MTAVLAEAELAKLAQNERWAANGNGRRVLVLGAGMAGLMAAYQLERAGYSVTILEARTRAGGRIETLRDPFSHGLFAEAGAMRLPASHRLTHWLIDHVGLAAKRLPFTEGVAFYQFAGQVIPGRAADAAVDALFELSESELKRSCDDLWGETWRSYVHREGVPRQWHDVEGELGHLSVRAFLAEHCGWSAGAIERFGLLYNYESLLESSVLELLREEAGAYYDDISYLDGGMDQLPVALAKKLGAEIRFGARVVRIRSTSDSVSVVYRDASGNFAEPVEAEFAIVTLPLPVLRFVEFEPRLGLDQHRVIRQLHYDAATKVFLQVRERFWERLPESLRGGQVITDRPVRNAYYPPHGAETGRGVVLASYTWGDDADGWASLPPNARIAEAAEQLEEIHRGIDGLGEIGTLVEGGASKSWHDDEFAGGAYALFDPGQHRIMDPLREPARGRIFFAGEHLSEKHAWIQGALESGIQAAHDLHATAASSHA